MAAKIPWLVMENTAGPLTPQGEKKALEHFGRSRFGRTWFLVHAETGKEAFDQVLLYEAGQHPDQREMELFTMAYQGGIVQLPIPEITLAPRSDP